MTDITAKPFDWNDNLSKEALEDFEGIRKDLPYCICQNIGMALAKLELLEKQGCKVIDPSGSSSEKSNKSEIMTGWIPVSERLPEEFESVLVCFKSQGGMAQAVSERFGTYTGYKWSALAGIEPIAWMPLPEPYKAEGSDKE